MPPKGGLIVMAGKDAAVEADSGSTREFLVGLGRAFAGALIFSLPLMMTMEMWSLGVYIDPFRIALLLLVLLPLLVGLSLFGGIRRNTHIVDDLADALIAIAVAAIAAIVVLSMFAEIDASMSWREVIGKVALQIVPGSIGAMLAQNQLGGSTEDMGEYAFSDAYGGEILLMVVGGLFMSLNIAPTEEIILIAFKMSIWQDIALALLSLALMHGVVYVVEFRGTHPKHPEESFFSVFARFTVVGYAAVFLVSLYILWTFGRLEGLSLEQALSLAVVLSFPGAIGAALARLIL